MLILAIDPGPEASGWCRYCDGVVLESGVAPNAELREMIRRETPTLLAAPDILAIESIESFGMAVGASVFATCIEIGRFIECWHRPDEVRLIGRREVKLHLCGSPRAKDSNIRQALIDQLGPPGTKRNPGQTYGVQSHAWSALAIAVVAAGDGFGPRGGV